MTTEFSKKDLLEMRLKGQLQQLTSCTVSDSNSSRVTTAEDTDISQKSLNENEPKIKCRKRKSTFHEIHNLHGSPRCNDPTTPLTPLFVNMIPNTVTNESVEANMKELMKRNEELEMSVKEFHEREKKYLDSLEAGKEWIKKLLTKQHKLKNKSNQDELIENSKKLGTYVTVRKGTKFVEEWQNGSAFQDIEESIVENNRMKDEVEKCKKNITKRKPNDKPSNIVRSPIEKPRRSRLTLEETSVNNTMLPINQMLTIEEYQRYDELFKIRQNALRKEEAELNMERNKLIRDRDIHIKRMKIIGMEKASRFNGNALMKNRYILLELIGKGGFSEVFKAFDLVEYKYVAFKIHQLNSDWSDEHKANYIKHAMRECNIHKTLDHPNIVKLFDVFEIDNDSFATILEYCDGDDLDSLLKYQRYLPEREARFIIIQIVEALRYLNERKPPIIHYDLKPGNILLLSGINSWHVKITDFGLSKILPPDNNDVSMDLTSPGAGTYWYLPPECFLLGILPTRISSKVDVWSIGVILFQCLFGRKPFGNDLSQTNILEQKTILQATSVVFPPKPIISHEAKQFMLSCLVYSKESRMDVIQMSQSSYLKTRKNERLNIPPLANLKQDEITS